MENQVELKPTKKFMGIYLTPLTRRWLAEARMETERTNTDLAESALREYLSKLLNKHGEEA